jgi:hypothetical protein
MSLHALFSGNLNYSIVRKLLNCTLWKHIRGQFNVSATLFSVLEVK